MTHQQCLLWLSTCTYKPQVRVCIWQCMTSQGLAPNLLAFSVASLDHRALACQRLLKGRFHPLQHSAFLVQFAGSLVSMHHQ